MKQIRLMAVVVMAFLWAASAMAQQYTSLSGLIHVPSADMCPEGEARIGVHYLHEGMLPNGLAVKGEKYNSGSAYLSVTPFSWVEIGYTFTLMKGRKQDLNNPEDKRIGYYHKDRHLSIKVRPLKEGKWWPSVAIGSDDPVNSKGLEDAKHQYFCNYYVTATKHVDFKGHIVGAHLAYRKWKRDNNSRWNGVVGGITYQPAFQQNLRLIAEYTGNEVNVGLDWKLFKHLLVQTSLQDGKYFSGGLCFCLNLL